MSRNHPLKQRFKSFAIKDLINEAKVTGNWSKVENADVSEVFDMSHMFYNIKGIEDLDLSKWNTSNVVEMISMFEDSDFNSPLNFDTSNVVNMSGMFAGSKFNKPLNLDTSSVINMSYMFMSSEYNQALHFNTSNVIDMSAMFHSSCYNHLLHFDTSNVISMDSMFFESKYNQPLHFDTSNVENMAYIFRDSDFNQDISDWEIIENYNNKSAIRYRDECIEKNNIKRDMEHIGKSIIKDNKVDIIKL